MKNCERTFVLLLFVSLFSSQLSVNASNNLLPKAQGISLSSEFTDKLKTLQPNDVILVWVDIEAWVDRFNDTYLPADPALYGIRWILITFAPDVKQTNMFWVLAEVDVGKMQEISKIPWVKNITLIETGEYVKPSSNPKIIGGLHYTVQRAIHEENKSLQVIVYVEEQTTQIQRDASLENITALINQLGGEVLKTGSYKNRLVVQIPSQVIENITDNSYVSSIYSRGPVVFCREALSNKQNTEQAFYCFVDDLAIKLGCFVVLGVIIDFVTADRKARRRRLTLYVTVILSTVFLSTLPSAQALDISTGTIRATNVWDADNRGAGVNVAVIDSGIDFNHPDFPPEAIRASWNIPNNNATLAQDTWGHGTHVAGIIAGRGVNNTLYRGVAWEADLIVVRILFNEDLEDAVRWIIDNKDQYNIRIISSSVSPSNVPPGGDGRDSPYATALDDAVDAGIVVIQAAGNHGPDPQTIVSPGNAFNVITVGAIDDQNTQSVSDDILAAFSSRGPTGDGRTKPDVVAPGVRIISCRAAGTDIRVLGWDTYIDDNYVESTGTSMAAPHVAGAAALILQAHPYPYWGPKAVKCAIMGTASLNDNLAPLSRNDRGTGIVDVAEALTCSMEIPVDEAEDEWTYSYGPEGQPHGAEAHPWSGMYYIYAHAVGHPNEAGAGATLKKSFVPDYNITDPTFFFTFHDIGDLECYFPSGEANLKANLTLCHGDTTLFNELFDVHEVPPGILDTNCRHEVDHTYEGQLLDGETYSIEYGFSVFAHNGIALFGSPNFIEACQLTVIGGRVRLRNPSFKQRMQLAPGVYEVQYWSNSTHHGWRELKGDANEDGSCNWKDQLLLSLAYGSRRGDSNYGWRVDFNGDGIVNWEDLHILALDFGQTATCKDGSYSWYITRRGEENLTSTNLTQWLCDLDVNAMKGKNVTFTFWFKPELVGIVGYAFAKIFYINETGEELTSSEKPFLDTTWNILSVTAAIPEDTIAIKVIIHCIGVNYKVRIDKASLSALN